MIPNFLVLEKKKVQSSYKCQGNRDLGLYWNRKAAKVLPVWGTTVLSSLTQADART